MEINENNVVRQLKKGNEQALYYVIDHYGWVMKTVVKRQMGTLPHLWDDCMNDTLLAVWSILKASMRNGRHFRIGWQGYAALRH